MRKKNAPTKPATLDNPKASAELRCSALLGQLRVKLDGHPVKEVPREAYVKAKTKQLREFGYPTLTEEHVNEQVDALLSKKQFGEGLTVIGKFMEGEVLA